MMKPLSDLFFRSVCFTLPFFIFETMSSGREPMPIHRRPNVAHRGASHLAPENTLMAYRIAISAGAHGGECDVYRSTDGVLFLIHDRTTERTLDGENKKVTELSFEELRKRDAGLWRGKQFRGEQVPSLDEYLELLKDTTCFPVIHLSSTKGIEAEVIERVRAHGMVETTTLITFSQDSVKIIRRLEPRISVGYLYGERLQGDPENHADRLAELLIARCKELDTNLLDLHDVILSKKLVAKLREAGIHVWCWTVNDKEKMATYLSWGVESVTTDRPEILTEVIRSREKE